LTLRRDLEENISTATSIIMELRHAHEGFDKWVMTLHNMKAPGLTKPDLEPKNIVASSPHS